MLTHRGGQSVSTGTYWNIMNGQRVDANTGDSLPGGNSTVYIKLSGALMLLTSPILGLLFAVFLPFIGIAMTVNLIGKKFVAGLSRVAVKSTTFGWRPIETYLNGMRRRKNAPTEPKKNRRM